ncbi:hypothetical protein HU200_036566 [Digitaria exilis]|uniref:Uncharacterized protein n=1 Tax=Digitaria exilis TaxID=1010633 RepID=A0A835BG36_9POAL|nr:hypothetical protein HU200_036566 [Digitaria exilis]
MAHPNVGLWRRPTWRPDTARDSSFLSPLCRRRRLPAEDPQTIQLPRRPWISKSLWFPASSSVPRDWR